MNNFKHQHIGASILIHRIYPEFDEAPTFLNLKWEKRCQKKAKNRKELNGYPHQKCTHQIHLRIINRFTILVIKKKKIIT